MPQSSELELQLSTIFISDLDEGIKCKVDKFTDETKIATHWSTIILTSLTSQPIGFDINDTIGFQSVYIFAVTLTLHHIRQLASERFGETNLTTDMLIGALLLAALFSSDVAADPDLNIESENLTETNQDLEKRGFSGRGLCYDGVYYFGHCYKFVDHKMTWIEAELYCQSLGPGSHLASIHWEKQNEFIGQMITDVKGVLVRTWIGLHDFFREGTFLWTDGSPTDFIKWGLGEPNNSHGSEECGHTGFRQQKIWNDQSCETKLPFICSNKVQCN
ncbi:C-type lectin BiL-like [Mustelus asterias]